MATDFFVPSTTSFGVSLSLDIQNTEEDLIQQITAAVAAEFRKNVGKRRLIQEQVRNYFYSKMVLTRAFQQTLLYKDIRGHLGVLDVATKLSRAIRLWCDNYIKVTPPKDDILTKAQIAKRGRVGSFVGFDVRFIPTKDFREIVNEDFASYESENGYSVDWLEWMLTETGIILPNHNYLDVRKIKNDRSFIRAVSASRTKQAIMVKRGRGRSAGYRLPPELAGSYDNNFIVNSADEVLGTPIGKSGGVVKTVMDDLDKAINITI